MTTYFDRLKRIELFSIPGEDGFSTIQPGAKGTLYGEETDAVNRKAKVLWDEQQIHHGPSSLLEGIDEWEELPEITDAEINEFYITHFGEAIKRTPAEESNSNTLFDLEDLTPVALEIATERLTAIFGIGTIRFDVFEDRYIEMFLTLKDWRNPAHVKQALDESFIWFK